MKCQNTAVPSVRCRSDGWLGVPVASVHLFDFFESLSVFRTTMMFARRALLADTMVQLFMVVCGVGLLKFSSPTGMSHVTLC